jgi:ATP-dependent helicase/nuclease subunit A
MTAVVDQRQRLRALDPAGSFIVQAPAGSGKTELLTQRILALLAMVEHPEEILAITFTRKAAAEMRHRLLEALTAAAGPPPAADHARRTWELAGRALQRDLSCGWNLLDTPALLAIQTIDSFNAGLVRRMPWLTRFGGSPRVTEDPQRLYRQAARRTLARAAGSGRGGAAGARVLAHLDNRQDRLEALLVAMLQRRDQWLRHLAGRSVDEERAALEGALAAYVSGCLEDCRAALPPALWARLAPLARYAADNLERERPLGLLAGVTALPAASGADLPLWQGLADLLLTAAGEPRRRLDKTCGFPASGPADAAAMKAALLELLAASELGELAPRLHALRQLPRPAYGEEQWAILGDLVEVLNLAAAELWLVFAENGETDFAEVAMRALAALREGDAPSELLLQLDTRIRHILVDEFQDTSCLQYALLTTLTAGWQPGDGRTLFVVGDPMQSIYRFREAEVGLFLGARRAGIGQVPLESLTLAANFRSRAFLVDWFNTVFARVFPRREDLARGAVAYSPAVGIGGGEAGEGEKGGGVEVLPRCGRDDAAEAREVLDLTRQALARGERVAILVRARTHLGAILPVLRVAGIPYLAQDVDLLAERPAARDLVALSRALLHAGDRLAWLSVLRAPWCGLLLADLEALVGDRPRATVPGLLADPQRLETLSADGRQRAARTFAILQRARGQRGRLGLRRLVEGCWLALGGPACYAAADLDDAGQVFDLLSRLDAGGDLDPLEALEEGLQRLYAAPDGTADGQLQVMTIHKAKGLEFDTVILPGLGLRSRGGEALLLRWLELPEAGLMLAPIPRRDGGGDAIYAAIGTLEKERQVLETVRLLYVAATRARRRLCLLGHFDRNAAGLPVPPAGSLLEVLWPALGADFEAGVPADAIAPAPPAPSAGSPELRRLPRDWAAPLLGAAPLPPLQAVVRPSQQRGEGGGAATVSTAGWTARAVGTVLHGLLERIGRDGLEAWSEERVAGLEEELRRRLQRLGVAGEELAAAADRVRTGVQTALAGPNGAWILARHPVAAAELPLVGPQVAGVVDRTFVAADGIRWVVDYKTSEPRRGESQEAFFAGEADRYHPQLAGYAQLLKVLEPERSVRAGLYFPLFDGWCEVPV